tara:strand:- start:459 stop:797 length:339 start_codon:yes stop_codon:yes gene_type:complete
VSLGILVTSGLIRYGPAFENVAWASLFFLAPLGCIYYPLEILPYWLQMVAVCLPLVHLFEELRNILINDFYNINRILLAICLTSFYLTVSVVIFSKAYQIAKKRGTLISMGE